MKQDRNHTLLNSQSRREFLGKNMPDFRSSVTAALASGVLVWGAISITSVQAVQLSADEKGEALILPVFSTTDGLQTLLTVTNTETANRRPPRIAKITFRDSGGRFLLSVNAYINAAGAWVAAMSRSASGTTVQFPGPICTIGQRDGQAVAMTSASIDTRIGFIEVLEAGAIDGSTGTAEADQGHCVALADIWNEGEWTEDNNKDIVAPEDALRATASIIDVNRGTMYSVGATALARFSDIPQHTFPGSERPDLSSAHDPGTDAGRTTSVNCEKGVCIEDTWPRPIDAVAAALLAYEAEAEFVIDQSILAGTEFIISYPLRHYYSEGDAFFESDITLLTSDRLGEFRPAPDPCDPLISCNYSLVIAQEQSVNAVDFSQPDSNIDSVQASRILGIPHNVKVSRGFFPDAGTAKFELRNLAGQFTSNEERSYRGVPAIVIAFQEYVNGTLRDSDGEAVRANYGNSFRATRTNRFVLGEPTAPSNLFLPKKGGN